MKSYGFECDVKDVLPEIGTPVAGKNDILQNKFTYTYLVFDFDAHHKTSKEKGQGLPIDTIVQKNISKLEEMAKYFVDETDPTIGRLYINYPMMESYRDCTDFFDASYKDNEISIDDISNYKSIAGKKRLAGIDVSKYTRDNFDSLTRMNVFKLNHIQTGLWNGLPYDQYLDISEGIKILDSQTQKVISERKIGVLNTSLFILLDYYGNRDGFYDSIVKTGMTVDEGAQSERELQTI